MDEIQSHQNYDLHSNSFIQQLHIICKILMSVVAQKRSIIFEYSLAQVKVYILIVMIGRYIKNNFVKVCN